MGEKEKSTGQLAFETAGALSIRVDSIGNRLTALETEAKLEREKLQVKLKRWQIGASIASVVAIILGYVIGQGQG